MKCGQLEVLAIYVMYKLLQTHIQKRISLTEDEFSACRDFFTPHEIKRRQFLLREGDVCKSIAFVSKGCLRCYTIDDNGGEHVVQFAIEDWWISDLYSFLTGEPAEYTIDALEDSELLLLDAAAQENLCTTIPKFERFFKLLHQNNYIATHRRIVASLSASAEERYKAFLANYPQLAERLPQHQIASYLGITPESLSRVGKQLFEKK